MGSRMLKTNININTLRGKSLEGNIPNIPNNLKCNIRLARLGVLFQSVYNEHQFYERGKLHLTIIVTYFRGKVYFNQK